MIRYTGCLILFGLVASLGWSCAPQGTVGALTGRNTSSKVSLSPSILYTGDNEITLSSNDGLREVQVEADGRKERVIVEGAGKFPDCPTEVALRIRLETQADEPVTVTIKGKNCLGNPFSPFYLQNQTWRTDRITFADVKVGQEACREFRVTPGWTMILDSITVPDDLPIRLGFEASDLMFPLVIKGGKELAFTVCFTGEKPGTYIFPVTSWMRRDEPAGSSLTYPVSDTGVVKVVGN